MMQQQQSNAQASNSSLIAAAVSNAAGTNQYATFTTSPNGTSTNTSSAGTQNPTPTQLIPTATLNGGLVRFYLFICVRECMTKSASRKIKNNIGNYINSYPKLTQIII